MNHLLIILFILFGVNEVFAQYTENEFNEFINKSSTQEQVMETSLLMEQGFYHYAEKITDYLLRSEPENCNYNYRKGYLILLSRSDYYSATPYLEKAVTDINKNFDRNSAMEKSASVDAIYYLGRCYHAAGKVEEAKTKYNEFISRSDKKSKLVTLSKMQIGQCNIAAEMIQNPNPNISVKNAGPVINSSFPEYSAIIALDGSALFYTSRRPWENGASDAYIDGRNNLHPEDVFVSYLDTTENWSAPVRLDFCKSENNEATVAVNTDERRVYVYQDQTGQGDIYYSDFSQNTFKDVQYLDIKDVNTKYWEPHTTVSPDGSTMYIVSDRPEGYGGRDIYQIVKKRDGTWGKPENMGAEINTAYDEDSPFISIDGKNLYFSSNGPKSMGGFDILMSIKSDKNKWSESTNLGYPINSCGDDLYYTTTIDGYIGYFTSFRPDGSGEKDIYQVTNNYLGIKNLCFLKGKFYTVKDKKLPEDVGITFKCTNCGESTESVLYPRMRDGMIITMLEPCKTYEMIYHHGAQKKEIYRETITTDCDKHYSVIERNVMLNVDDMTIAPMKEEIADPVTVLEEVPVVELKNLEVKYFFKYDDNKLSMKGRDFRKFLKQVEKQLEITDQPITIKVFSSASHVPTKKHQSNQQLADLRAENVKYDIITYFQGKKKMQNRINAVIVSAVVEGPEYENDNQNEDKYKPYQFVILKTE